MEWAWGLERGTLQYYLASPPNDIYLRKDIARMYASAEFVLMPTHKTCQDAMEFSGRIGFRDRDEDDYSPRRPLTALGRIFRYVFLPFSDAARKIAQEIPMQRQTDEDWNRGIDPCTGEAMDPWVKDFPVVESHCHVVSICYFARKVLDVALPRGLSFDIWPWMDSLHCLEARWGIGRYGTAIEVPQWFIDVDTSEDDDESLSGTEATGYWPFLGSDTPSKKRVPGDASSGGTNVSQSSSRVLEWVKDVPQLKVPLRRSDCFAMKAIIPSVFSPGPVRKVKTAESRKGRTKGREPRWMRQNGRFPTRQFTSNDWALFHYGTRLSDVEDSYTY
ncbi:hypothetical protein EV715DRAFT_291552 [Schizophyllum commune]